MNKKIEHLITKDIENKWCSYGNHWVPVKDFYRNVKKWDGLSNKCKNCQHTYTKLWSMNNESFLVKTRERKRKYSLFRRSTDYSFRIANNLRKRVGDALKGKNKSKKTLELLGCSLDELREYLESKFDNNMTWDNYGTYWSIDHIIPCKAFDLSKESEQKKCFHYTNLQPLTAIENIKKSDFLENGERARNYVMV